MKVLALPPSLLVLVPVFSLLALSAAQPEADKPKPRWKNTHIANATTATGFFSAVNGSGAAYATACRDARFSYDAARSSWDAVHNTVLTETLRQEGILTEPVTYYENATTLCDGHPRVTYSPAISISEAWRTVTAGITAPTIAINTIGIGFTAPSPSCSIDPKDCDGLWVDYSKSVAAAARVTAAPVIQTPPCNNQSVAASLASLSKELYGCGPCTIYGDGVELVYFPVPTTVSRDMCATTPSGSLTSYGPGAVLTAYAGKNYGANDAPPAKGVRTAVVDGHTFTTGTAYISISKVYAMDRCSKTIGSVVTDAILAMPSESVLSLRYTQPKFQALLTTDHVTGYPVSYADFNNPIPWSAWIGQTMCALEDDKKCAIIYENNFKPQLAIPPEITSLSPDFVGCQMWYNGLWDPPLALTEVNSAEAPTLPGGYGPKTTVAAQPIRTPGIPTSKPTAPPNQHPSSTQQGHAGNAPRPPNAARPIQPGYRSTPPAGNLPAATNHAGGAGDGKGLPAPNHDDGNAGGQPAHTGSSPVQAQNGNANGDNGSTGNRGGNGESGSNGGAINNGGSGNHGSDNNPNSNSNSGNHGSDSHSRPDSNYVPTTEPWTKEVTIDGSKYVAKADNREVVIGNVTCAAGGPVQTLPGGTVCSYGDAGLTLEAKTTIVFDAPATGIHLGPQATGDSRFGHATSQPDGTIGGSAGTNSGGNSDKGPGSGEHTSSNFGANSNRIGDADTVIFTVGNEVKTAVQKHDGGPIVFDKTLTLTPGGEATTLPNGYFIGVAPDGRGLIVGSSNVLDIEPTPTGPDNSVSGAIRSGLGYANNQSDASSPAGGNQPNTTGENGASSTGAAAVLASFEALNFAAVIAILITALVV